MPTPNPYMIQGKDAILPSYCVYMDILGVRDETTIAFKENKGQELFDKFMLATSKAVKFIKDEDTRLWVHKIFTDNVLLGYPIRKSSDGESEFGLLISGLMYYQLSMALDGFFVRGAFSMDHLYVGADVVYGPAILEAYKLESEIANNPRIIFSDEVMDLVRAHLKYYGDPKDSPQYEEIMLDTDGRYFINYLYGIIENDEYSIDESALMMHKKNVEDRLRQFQNNSHIWSKYLWVANYHNYFCKLIKGFPDFKKDFFIDNVLMVQEPKRLV